MGLRDRKRREAFFRAHPMCCFCGGVVPATQEDHIPARSLFRGRQWPEGYVFPACEPCNRGSSLDELVAAWVFRIPITECGAQDEQALMDALLKLNRRRPEWVAKTKEMSRVETRRYLRERGMAGAVWPMGEPYLFTMPSEFVEALKRYAAKLGRALYYKHVGRALPAMGYVSARLIPNADWWSPSIPWEKLTVVSGEPVVSRSGKTLTDQFDYRFAQLEGGSAACFFLLFGESTAMAVFVFESEAEYRAMKALRADQRLSPRSAERLDPLAEA